MFSGNPVVPTNWPGKAKLPGERFATGATPVPESVIVCGLPRALSTREMAAVSAPRALGVKVTLIWHEAFAASELPQVWFKLKSLLFAPVSEILVKLRA